MDLEKPLIGITGPQRGFEIARSCIGLAIRLAGGEPAQLRPGHAPPARELDGIVISGGHDIEPVLYKSVAEVEGHYDAERDRFELELLNQALAASMPILGICRGAQLLNVSLGGDLFQDLQELHNDKRRRRTILPLKHVSIAENSQLHGIVGNERLRVNSLHNQAIDTSGVGLKVVARDRRNVIQAVESVEEKFCIGVQWHPEYLIYQRASRRLFRALVEATGLTPNA